MFKSKIVQNFSSVKLIRFFHNVTTQKLYMFVWLASIAALLESIGISLLFPLLVLIFSNDIIDNKSSGPFFDYLAQYIIVLRDQSSLIIVFLTVLGVFFIIITLKSSLLLTSQLHINRKKRKLRLYLRETVFKKITLSNLEFLQARGLGNVQSLLIEQAERVVSCFASYCAFLVRLLLTLMYTIFVFYLDPLFGAMAFSISFLIFFILKFANTLIRTESKKISVASGYYNSEINGVLSALKYLTFSGRLPIFHKRVSQYANTISNSDWLMGNIHAAISFIREPSAFLILSIIRLSSYFFSGLHWTSTLAAAALFYRSVTSAFDLQIYLQKFLEHSASVILVIKEVESLKPLQKKLQNTVKKNINKDFTKIVVNKLEVFRNNINILKEINFNVKTGDCVLISGKSGSGKTTFIDTLLGLIPWSSGDIYINDKKYEDQYSLMSANSNVGYLGQRPSVFQDSLLFNLTLHYKSTNEIDKDQLKKIKSICLKTEIWNEINRSDRGLNSELDTFGDIFSGGQLQRICLARELLRERNVYIFDESTSALDNSTEKIIINTIGELKKKALIIIVSHSDKFFSVCNKRYEILDGKLFKV